MKQGYIQKEGRALQADGEFKHIMAVALNPASNYTEGVVRCIVSREGDVEKHGYIDRSELRRVTRDGSGNFTVHDRVLIKDEELVVQGLLTESLDFIGLEDPDIWVDEVTNIIHLYFTLPLLDKNWENSKIHLGHAEGADLQSLVMTTPVLLADVVGGAKEVAFAPKNSRGVYYHLVESSVKEDDFTYSTIRQAIALDMGKGWQFGETLFHPKAAGIPWAGGHASPGPLFPRTFIDVGEGKLVGVMNGREANRMVEGEIVYGVFSVGLFIYDHEKGKIDWVSQVPFIQDTEAVTITFASQFVETETGKGVLYAHVDDSFIRAYELNAEGIQALLPQSL